MREILVVDPDLPAGRSVARILRPRPTLHADGAASGWHAILTAQPLLVLARWKSDRVSSSYDGLDLLRQARRRAENTPVVIYDAEPVDDAEVARAFLLGATDVVSSALTRPKELLARVRAALARNPTSPNIIEVGGISIDVPGHVVRVAGRIAKLTQGDFRLLVYLARNAGRCVSRSEVYAEVFETTYRGRDSNALEAAISRLRPKLGTAGEQLVAVPGVGYRLDCVPEGLRQHDGRELGPERA